MGTTLTGTAVKDTYDSLIKVTDNGPIGTSLKTLTDGLGNDSALGLSSFGLKVNQSATLITDTATLCHFTNNFLYLRGGTAGLVIGDDGLSNRVQFEDNGAVIFEAGSVERMRITSAGNVGIGTSSPAATLDVLGTSFLRGNVNAGKTSNINVTTAVNGVGGGNREFDTFTGASATGFTGTDSSDQGYGFFPVSIVSGRSYEVSATMVITNGNPLTFITSTGLNFATDTVQIAQVSPVSGTTYRFVASGNASYFGISATNSGGGMTCVVSNFSLKEVGSVLVTSNSNVGVGTTAPAVKLDVVGNIRSSTGILFGSDTAAANSLDDYEEGTFTPTFNGTTRTGGTLTARYTKIGRLVHYDIFLFGATFSGSSGPAFIGGFPFTANTQVYGQGLISYNNCVDGNTNGGYVDAGGTTFFPVDENNSTVASFIDGTADRNLMISGSYTV